MNGRQEDMGGHITDRVRDRVQRRPRIAGPAVAPQARAFGRGMIRNESVQALGGIIGSRRDANAPEREAVIRPAYHFGGDGASMRWPRLLMNSLADALQPA